MIRLLDETNDLHNYALGYFQYFLEHDYIIRMSTIAVAEFCVKDSIQNLPLRNILLSPFNAYHASKSGESAKILYEAKSKGVLEVDITVIRCPSNRNTLTSEHKSQFDLVDFYAEGSILCCVSFFVIVVAASTAKPR